MNTRRVTGHVFFGKYTKRCACGCEVTFDAAHHFRIISPPEFDICPMLSRLAEMTLNPDRDTDPMTPVVTPPKPACEKCSAELCEALDGKAGMSLKLCFKCQRSVMT